MSNDSRRSFHESVFSAYRTLWLTVIHMAILEAEGRLSEPNISERKRKMLKQQARTWLTEDGLYFRRVCELARIEPDFALKKFKRRFV